MNWGLYCFVGLKGEREQREKKQEKRIMGLEERSDDDDDYGV
jgi:hypothetical protein